MLDKPRNKEDRRRGAEPAARDRSVKPARADKAPRGVLAVLWSWTLRTLMLLAIATAAWFFGSPLLLGPLVPVEPVIRADFVQSVVASGHVEAPFRVNVGSQITGTVADVPVAEGQSVKAGDVLIRLDDREARAGVVQAESAIAQGEARLRQLRELILPSAEEALRQTQATLVNAERAFERAERLAKDRIAAQATLDDATRALNIARAQVRSAEFQVYTNRPGGSDYVLAETQLNQARANLATAQSRLSYTVIEAPRDGVLIARDVERGNIVQPNNVLMKLSPTGELQLVVQIDERNLGLLALGQRAIASADAFPKQTFPVEVAFINPGVDLQRASVQVKLRVAEPPPYLRQDMTVSVDVETARRPGALILPAQIIRGMSGGKPWVMKVNGEHAVRQPVEVGLVSGGKAEILNGLTEGEQVIPSSVTVKEGDRIRPRRAEAGPS
jgi:HlyD family secretion protein